MPYHCARLAIVPLWQMFFQGILIRYGIKACNITGRIQLFTVESVSPFGICQMSSFSKDEQISRAKTASTGATSTERLMKTDMDKYLLLTY
jgi:hypothetical protein